MEIEETELQDIWLFLAAWGKVQLLTVMSWKWSQNVKIEENYTWHDTDHDQVTWYKHWPLIYLYSTFTLIFYRNYFTMSEISILCSKDNKLAKYYYLCRHFNWTASAYWIYVYNSNQWKILRTRWKTHDRVNLINSKTRCWG